MVIWYKSVRRGSTRGFEGRSESCGSLLFDWRREETGGETVGVSANKLIAADISDRAGGRLSDTLFQSTEDTESVLVFYKLNQFEQHWLKFVHKNCHEFGTEFSAAAVSSAQFNFLLFCCCWFCCGWTHQISFQSIFVRETRLQMFLVPECVANHNYCHLSQIDPQLFALTDSSCWQPRLSQGPGPSSRHRKVRETVHRLSRECVQPQLVIRQSRLERVRFTLEGSTYPAQYTLEQCVCTVDGAASTLAALLSSFWLNQSKVHQAPFKFKTKLKRTNNRERLRYPKWNPRRSSMRQRPR